MAASPKRVCWDACVWISLIQKEKIQKDGKLEDRYALCRSVIDLAEKGKVEIVTSGLSFVEVCKNPNVKSSSDDLIADYFERDYILVMPLDRVVGTHARGLMFAKHAGLKPPDAAHLATALLSNVDEMHTFDDDLLDLDGKLTKSDGTVLKICKPAHGGASLPLLDGNIHVEARGDASKTETFTSQPANPDAPGAAVPGDG